MATAKIINFDAFLERTTKHQLSHVVCLNCSRRWLSLRYFEIELPQIECPKCQKVGFVIETGESLSDEEWNLLNDEGRIIKENMQNYEP